MAHLIEKMAYIGQTPWHELGNQLPPKQPLEVWARQAGNLPSCLIGMEICSSAPHWGRKLQAPWATPCS